MANISSLPRRKSSDNRSKFRILLYRPLVYSILYSKSRGMIFIALVHAPVTLVAQPSELEETYFLRILHYQSLMGFTILVPTVRIIGADCLSRGNLCRTPRL